MRRSTVIQTFYTTKHEYIKSKLHSICCAQNLTNKKIPHCYLCTQILLTWNGFNVLCLINYPKISIQPPHSVYMVSLGMAQIEKSKATELVPSSSANKVNIIEVNDYAINHWNTRKFLIMIISWTKCCHMILWSNNSVNINNKKGYHTSYG